jgi:hypothetical protein
MARVAAIERRPQISLLLSLNRQSMRADAVVFDLDDTLVELALSSPELLERTYERLGIEPPFPASDYYDRRDELAAESDGKPRVSGAAPERPRRWTLSPSATTSQS